MKYENFEQAEKLAEVIEHLQSLRNEIAVTREVSFNDTYIKSVISLKSAEPNSLEVIAMAFKENILQEYDNQISQLKQQFEAL